MPVTRMPAKTKASCGLYEWQQLTHQVVSLSFQAFAFLVTSWIQIGEDKRESRWGLGDTKFQKALNWFKARERAGNNMLFLNLPQYHFTKRYSSYVNFCWSYYDKIMIESILQDCIISKNMRVYKYEKKHIIAIWNQKINRNGKFSSNSNAWKFGQVCLLCNMCCKLLYS